MIRLYFLRPSWRFSDWNNLFRTFAIFFNTPSFFVDCRELLINQSQIIAHQKSVTCWIIFACKEFLVNKTGNSKSSNQTLTGLLSGIRNWSLFVQFPTWQSVSLNPDSRLFWKSKIKIFFICLIKKIFATEAKQLLAIIYLNKLRDSHQQPKSCVTSWLNHLDSVTIILHPHGLVKSQKWPKLPTKVQTY